MIKSSTDSISPFKPVCVSGRSNRRELVLSAKRLQKRRAQRADYFTQEMFGEVAWDIIITLYVKEENRYLPVTYISKSIKVPMTTTIRWIYYLTSIKLVITVSHSTDRRLRLVQMTDKGRDAMDRYITELLQG